MGGRLASRSKLPRRRPVLCALAVALGLLAAGCAGAAGEGGAAAATPAQPRGPDVHGEPLALLPPDAALVVRLDALQARASAHWPRMREILQRRAGDTLRNARDVLGFDPLEQGDVLALGLYLPPGLESVPDAHGWLVLYVRGAFDPHSVLAAAAANGTGGEPFTQRTVDGMTFRASGSRGYLFPARDVLVFFDPALAGRMARQLSGQERRSAQGDPRYASLVAQLPEASATLRVYADVRGLRATGALAGAPADPSGLDLAVLGVSAPDEVRLGAVAHAGSDAAAARVAGAVDALRREYLARWDVRLLALSRLLNQGVTAVSDGPFVRVHVEAFQDEAARVLAASQLVE